MKQPRHIWDIPIIVSKDMTRHGFAAPFVLIGVFVLLLALGGAYYLGKTQRPVVLNTPQVTDAPVIASLAPSTDQATNWKTYKLQPDSSLGYKEYSIAVPSSWKPIEHSSNFQGTETFWDSYEPTTYKLIIQQEKNLNKQTSQPFKTLKELTGFPYDVMTKIVDGQQSARVLPRAGSESIFKVLFFSKDAKLIFSIELDTPRDGSKFKEGEVLFDQILSTFKFTQ